MASPVCSAQLANFNYTSTTKNYTVHFFLQVQNMTRLYHPFNDTHKQCMQTHTHTHAHTHIHRQTDTQTNITLYDSSSQVLKMIVMITVTKVNMAFMQAKQCNVCSCNMMWSPYNIIY